MIKTKWIFPYDEKGNTNFPKRYVSGVYLIRDGAEIVYIGESGVDVYKTLYRHFQSWEDSRQVRVTYKHVRRWNNERFTVRVIYCTAEKAEILERAMILKYKPKDNPEKYDDYFFNEYLKKQIKKIDDLPTEEPPPF